MLEKYLQEVGFRACPNRNFPATPRNLRRKNLKPAKHCRDKATRVSNFFASKLALLATETLLGQAL